MSVRSMWRTRCLVTEFVTVNIKKNMSVDLGNMPDRFLTQIRSLFESRPAVNKLPLVKLLSVVSDWNLIWRRDRD